MHATIVQVRRSKRTPFIDRQYSVFTTTEFSEPISTGNDLMHVITY